MSASTEVDIASTDFLVLYRSHFKSYLAVREIITFTEVIFDKLTCYIQIQTRTCTQIQNFPFVNTNQPLSHIL